MNEYETEEQQLEALKKWWKENGYSIIIGLMIGVSALYGWRYYDGQKNIHAVHASDMYMRVLQSTSSNNVDETAVDINNELINDFSDTPYAALSSLALAKSEYEREDVDAAIAQLELAKKHASDEMLKQIANLRLARVYLEQKNYDKVAALLSMSHEEAYSAQYEELRGDLYSAKGEISEAREAYDKAISLQGATASKWLRLKRQNLGV